MSSEINALDRDGNPVTISLSELANEDLSGVNLSGANLTNAQMELFSQLGGDIDGEAQDDESGFSVSLSADGSIVAIGAHNNDGNGNNSGHVRVYQYINDETDPSWVQLGGDIDGETEGDKSGYSVSLSADG